MKEQLEWIEQAQSEVAAAASVADVRRAIQTALKSFQATGLSMPVGMLKELHQKALQATDADLKTLKSDLGASLKNMRHVHEAMIDMAKRMAR